MVAALTAEKEPATFVRAIAAARESVPDIRALLVGDGPERGSVEALVRALHLEGTLVLAGFRDDARALIAAAHVAVLSSRSEGLPVVVLEALAAGIPMVATAAGGVPEAVRDGIEGFITPVGDHIALGDAIARVLNDDQLRHAMSTAARRRAATYSIERTADSVAGVYARVLEERSAPR
jgi:glycosyltransferase involved in cell wall biosynthesis